MLLSSLSSCAISLTHLSWYSTSFPYRLCSHMLNLSRSDNGNPAIPLYFLQFCQYLELPSLVFSYCFYCQDWCQFAILSIEYPRYLIFQEDTDNDIFELFGLRGGYSAEVIEPVNVYNFYSIVNGVIMALAGFNYLTLIFDKVEAQELDMKYDPNEQNSKENEETGNEIMGRDERSISEIEKQYLVTLCPILCYCLQ